MRRILAVTSVVAAVAVTGGAAAAVTLAGRHHSHSRASASGSASQVVSVTPRLAAANVTPPVAASKCRTPTAFTYSGTLSAVAPGTVKYQWVYSSGKPGPVRTVRFTSAGRKVVAGATARSRTAGGGWGEIKVISPVAQTSNKAVYKLLCGGRSVGGITAAAAVRPRARTVSCVTAPPAFTAAGSIRAAKAGSVSYYWAQSDGARSAPATLTFTKPGTQAVKPLTISPQPVSGTGAAVLVVTSPVTTASGPATYTLTCKASTTSPNVPATAPAPAGGPPPPPPMSITANGPATANFGQPYSGTVTVTGGDGHYTWGAASGLPPGLTATARGATLTISGTPNVLGLWTVSGKASDGESIPQTAGWVFNINVIYPPITINVSVSGPCTVGQPYSGTLTATGGDGTPFTWSVTGLPLGVTGTANGATYTFSGTPTASNLPASNPPEPGIRDVYVIVSDSEKSFERDFSIAVSPPS